VPSEDAALAPKHPRVDRQAPEIAAQGLIDILGAGFGPLLDVSMIPWNTILAR
jgi:hypothetical protein